VVEVRSGELRRRAAHDAARAVRQLITAYAYPRKYVNAIGTKLPTARAARRVW